MLLFQFLALPLLLLLLPCHLLLIVLSDFLHFHLVLDGLLDFFLLNAFNVTCLNFIFYNCFNYFSISVLFRLPPDPDASFAYPTTVLVLYLKQNVRFLHSIGHDSPPR
jgi:hypothetical protein